MVNFFSYFLIFIRYVERNNVIREVALQRQILICECSDATFTGVPCRHMILLVNTQKELKYGNLQLNPRWRMDYYEEKNELNDKSNKKTVQSSKGKTRKVVCLFF